MSLLHSATHASSQTPSGFVRREERLDLSMSRDLIRFHKTVYGIAHLNYLEILGKSVFPDDKCVNLLYNAFRLRWKVAGKVLRTLADHQRDLLEFLTLEIGNKRIIGDLFTEQAMYHLVEREETESMVVMSIMMRDIYEAQWNNWQSKATSENQHQSYHAMIIAQAQATSNQLSNNVLAFKDKAAPELRRWAEQTVARHLMAIITPGHLPARPAARSTNLMPEDSRSSTRELMGPDYGSQPSSRPDNSISNNDQSLTKSGPFEKPYQATIPAGFTLSTKRKSSPSAPYSRHGSSSKKVRVKVEGAFSRGPYETYQSTRSQPSASNNGRGELPYRGIDARHGSASNKPDHRQQTDKSSSYNEARQAKLRELQAKIDSFGKYDNLEHHGSFEQDAPVVDGPSYAEYLQRQEHDAGASLSNDSTFTPGQSHKKSFAGSEEGEIAE